MIDAKTREMLIITFVVGHKTRLSCSFSAPFTVAPAEEAHLILSDFDQQSSYLANVESAVAKRIPSHPLVQNCLSVIHSMTLHRTLLLSFLVVGTASLNPTLGLEDVRTTISPTIPLTGSPTNTTLPTNPPTFDDGNARKSAHIFEWGSEMDGCIYETPAAYLSCEDGGIINLEETVNAECEVLAEDFLRCFSLLGETDLSVTFSCTGTTEEQLTAAAQLFSSEAQGCNLHFSESSNAEAFSYLRGGSGVTYAVLGRFCRSDQGEMVVEKHYPCTEGTTTTFDDGTVSCSSSNYCIAITLCPRNGGDEECVGSTECTNHLGGVTISNSDDRVECTEIAEPFSLRKLSPSTLASYQFVEWSYSVLEAGCQWEAQPLTLTCGSGGRISLENEEDSTFCELQESDTIVCHPPEEFVAESRTSHSMTIWCYGAVEDQLVLSAMAHESAASCTDGGIVMQSISVSRACGAVGSDEFVTGESFCQDITQYTAQEGERPACLTKVQCEAGNWDSIVVPQVIAASYQLSDACAYAVKNPFKK